MTASLNFPTESDQSVCLSLEDHPEWSFRSRRLSRQIGSKALNEDRGSEGIASVHSNSLPVTEGRG